MKTELKAMKSILVPPSPGFPLPSAILPQPPGCLRERAEGRCQTKGGLSEVFITKLQTSRSKTRKKIIHIRIVIKRKKQSGVEDVQKLRELLCPVGASGKL